jgi:hypothetical protein
MMKWDMIHKFQMLLLNLGTFDFFFHNTLFIVERVTQHIGSLSYASHDGSIE